MATVADSSDKFLKVDVDQEDQLSNAATYHSAEVSEQIVHEEYCDVDRESVLLTFGFIRRGQKILHRKTISTIPVCIFDICASYYGCFHDEADPDAMAPGLEMTDGELQCHEGGYSQRMAVFRNIVGNGKHKWLFKADRGHGALSIGIWDRQYDPKSSLRHGINFEPCAAYVFLCNGARLNINGTREWTAYESYGTVSSNKEDIIEMVVNLTECTVSFCINGINWGVAHLIRKGAYSAVVTGNSSSMKVELLEYTKLHR